MPLIADHDPFYRTANYPLVHDCDMEPDLKDEATDLCVAAAEKYKDNLEKATQVRDSGYARCIAFQAPDFTGCIRAYSFRSLRKP